MKLSKGKCQITGVRVGEININLLNPMQPVVDSHFILLREDGTHAGQYTKAAGWSDASTKAFEDFIEKLEENILLEIFEESSGDQPQPVGSDVQEATQDVATLGDGKGVPQV